MSKNNKNAAKVKQKRNNRNNRTPGVNRTKKETKKVHTWFSKLKAGIHVHSRPKGVEDASDADEKS